MIHKNITHQFFHFAVHSLDERLQHPGKPNQPVGILDKVKGEKNRAKVVNDRVF
jgi:hypothetical protein